MNNKDIAKEWLLFADQDLESAKFLLGMRPAPLEIICYHCQQSAEKYIKGYIAYHGGSIVKTHDLTLLNKICLNYDQDFHSIQDDCIELTDYGVQIRYPFHLDVEENDVNNAAESAERIKKFILDKISI